MDCKATDNFPCGEPGGIRSNVQMMNFRMLSDDAQLAELRTEMGSTKCETLMIDGKPLSMCLPKFRQPSICSAGNIAGSFFATHVNTNNASCIIDPLNVLNKARLNKLLSRKDSKEEVNSNENSCLAEALKNFEKTWGKNSSDTMQKQSLEGTNSIVDARTLSSSYMSAQEDDDDNYPDISDIEEELNPDTETFSDPNPNGSELKSSGSWINVVYEHVTPVRKSTSSDAVLKKSSEELSIGTPETPLELESNDPNTPPVISEPKIKPVEETIGLSCCVEFVNNENTGPRVAAGVVKKSIPDEEKVICRPYLPPASASSTSSIASCHRPDEPSEKISKLIVDLIGPNSRVGKLIFQSCTAGQDVNGIYEEIKQCVQAELQMEDKIMNFFNKPTLPAAGAVSTVKCESLKRIDDNLVFVKEHLVKIQADLNDFKEHSLKQIETKVSHTEFAESNAVLRAKMVYLERKIFNDHRVMRQDMRDFRERITILENDAHCGFKSFPIWPFLAFIGAYSIVHMGRR